MLETNELITIKDYIRWAVSHFNESALFYGHGTDNALDEALALILHTIHLPSDTPPSLFDGRLTKAEKERLNQQIYRRINERVPTPYLTHEAWFAGLSFYVDERVLIPRSPIAELIQNHFQPWIKADAVNHILDLCTGSGCIAIACANAFPNALVDASDISSDALAVAKMNVTRHQMEEHVFLHQSDLFESLPIKKYNVIVSNPPYVDTIDMNSLPKEYHHEPTLGLTAGTDGLAFAIPILKSAANYLSDDGILVIEVGNSETALVEKYPTVPFTWLEFENDSGGVFLLTAEQVKKYKHVW